MIWEEFLVVEKLCDNADEKHYQKLIISDNGALFEGMCVCDEVHSYVILMTHLNTWIFCYLNLQINCKRNCQEELEEHKIPQRIWHIQLILLNFLWLLKSEHDVKESKPILKAKGPY